MTVETIKVWRYSDAPSDLAELASQGGDEDWLVLVPHSLVESLLEYGTPHWIDAMDSCHEPVRINLPNGDVLFVGSH